MPGGVARIAERLRLHAELRLGDGANHEAGSVVSRPSMRLMSMTLTLRALHCLAEGLVALRLAVIGGVAVLPGGVARLVERLRVQVEHLLVIVPTTRPCSTSEDFRPMDGDR